MKIFKRSLLILLLLVCLNLILIGINIFQKGGPYDGRSLADILGKPASDATVSDVERLSKSEIMQLFYAADAPVFSSIKGEYQAKTLAVGIMSPAANFFTHNFFGPGHWEGKAFSSFAANKGWGYNLFSVKDGNKAKVLLRARRMDTWIKKSEIDDKESFHLVYKAYNGGLVRSMHDEIRQINEALYIGLGYMTAGGGSINPAPFVVYGQPTAWVGLDKKM